MSQCAQGPGVSLRARECVRLCRENSPSVANARLALATPICADPFHAMCSRARIPRRNSAGQGHVPAISHVTRFTTQRRQCGGQGRRQKHKFALSDRGHCLQRCSLTDAVHMLNVVAHVTIIGGGNMRSNV